MKKYVYLTAITGMMLTMSGCSSLDQNVAYVIDQEQVNALENSQRQSRHIGHVVWVNPPMKKVNPASVTESPGQ